MRREELELLVQEYTRSLRESEETAHALLNSTIQDKLSGMPAGAYDKVIAQETAEYVPPRDQIASVLTDIVSMNA